MFKATLVLVAAGFVAGQQCNTAGFDLCHHQVAKCFQENPTNACSCRGAYDSCVKNLGCSQDIMNNIIRACEDAGCSATDCTPATMQALAPATCDAPTLQACGSALTTCVENNYASPSAVCTCRGTYDTCISNAGCPAATVNAVVAACEEAGCTASQCAASVSIPSTCDAPTLQSCGSALTTCVENNYASPSAVCTCRGTYDTCISNAGCPAATVNAVVAACEEAGCTASQCASSSVLTAPATCDSPTLQACGSALTTCVENNYSSPSAVCGCRGTYDQCISNAGCPAATVNAVVAACQEAGCTASQCAA